MTKLNFQALYKNHAPGWRTVILSNLKCKAKATVSLEDGNRQKSLNEHHWGPSVGMDLTNYVSPQKDISLQLCIGENRLNIMRVEKDMLIYGREKSIDSVRGVRISSKLYRDIGYFGDISGPLHPWQNDLVVLQHFNQVRTNGRLSCVGGLSVWKMHAVWLNLAWTKICLNSGGHIP